MKEECLITAKRAKIYWCWKTKIKNEKLKQDDERGKLTYFFEENDVKMHDKRDAANTFAQFSFNFIEKESGSIKNQPHCHFIFFCYLQNLLTALCAVLG